MNQSVVISGVGIFSPMGNSVEAFRSALFSGTSGVSHLRDSWLGSSFPVPFVAALDKNIFSGDTPATRFSELIKKLTHDAVAGAKAPLEFDAIILGSRDEQGFLVGIDAAQHQNIDDSLLDSMRPEAAAEAACEALRSLGHRPPPESQMICLLGACATSALAMGMAFHRIRAGEWKRVLAIAIDVELHPLAMTSYHLLGALSTADVPPQVASAPFSVHRSGFVLGEAAAAMLLESREEITKRKASVFGEIVGASVTSDAWHLTAGREDCAGAISAMENAIKDAGITKKDISYINAHGTATPVGDRLECLAIKKTFAERAQHIPISALKSQLGHTRIAAGMIEAIASCLMLKEQKIAPTLNFVGGDPDCDLDFVPEKARDAELNYVLSNSFGFGGQNACLVFKKI